MKRSRFLCASNLHSNSSLLVQGDRPTEVRHRIVDCCDDITVKFDCVSNVVGCVNCLEQLAGRSRSGKAIQGNTPHRRNHCAYMPEERLPGRTLPINLQLRYFSPGLDQQRTRIQQKAEGQAGEPKRSVTPLALQFAPSRTMLPRWHGDGDPDCNERTNGLRPSRPFAARHAGPVAVYPKQAKLRSDHAALPIVVSGMVTPTIGTEVAA